MAATTVYIGSDPDAAEGIARGLMATGVRAVAVYWHGVHIVYSFKAMTEAEIDAFLDFRSEWDDAFRPSRGTAAAGPQKNAPGAVAAATGGSTEINQQEESAMSTFSDLFRHVELDSPEARTLPVPAWAQGIEVEEDSSGGATAYFRAEFGEVLLAQSASRESVTEPWERDEESLIVRVEASTSPELIRALAADLQRAATALEGRTGEPLRRRPSAVDHLMDLEG